MLRQGGVIAFPTDTLYGLGADAFSSQAVERIYEIKGRPPSMALPLLLADGEWLNQVSLEVSQTAVALAQRFWPGGLTLVLKASPRLPRILTGGGDTIGVRVPDHPVPLALMRGLGRPITGTSANPSGGPDPATALEVERLLGEKVDCIIEDAQPPQGQPSTVVELTGAIPTLLRPGIVPLEAIEEVCGVPLG